MNRSDRSPSARALPAARGRASARVWQRHRSKGPPHFFSFDEFFSRAFLRAWVSACARSTWTRAVRARTRRPKWHLARDTDGTVIQASRVESLRTWREWQWLTSAALHASGAPAPLPRLNDSSVRETAAARTPHPPSLTLTRHHPVAALVPVSYLGTRLKAHSLSTTQSSSSLCTWTERCVQQSSAHAPTPLHTCGVPGSLLAYDKHSCSVVARRQEAEGGEEDGCNFSKLPVWSRCICVS